MTSRKTKHIKAGEARVIKVDRNALMELIYESIMEKSDDYFDLLRNSNTITSVVIDDDFRELTIYAMDYSSPRQIDIKSINEYVRKNVNITTESLFNGHNHKKYVTIKLPDQEN